MEPQEEQIVPADKNYSRLTLVTAIVLVLLGVVALAILDHYLGQLGKLAAKDPRAAADKALRVAAVVSWLGGLGLVGMAALLWRLGRRINLAGRFPPPGARVARDTRIRTGAKARTVANLAQAAALLLAIAGTVGIWRLYLLAAAALRL